VDNVQHHRFLGHHFKLLSCCIDTHSKCVYIKYPAQFDVSKHASGALPGHKGMVCQFTTHTIHTWAFIIYTDANHLNHTAQKYEELGLIYARTCRVRNGYSTGHFDASYTCYLMEAFMLQWDGFAPGMCAQRDPFSNRRWRYFCRARHGGATKSSPTYHVQTGVISRANCSLLRALVVFVLFCSSVVFNECS
jgi:hypothetical protein